MKKKSVQLRAKAVGSKVEGKRHIIFINTWKITGQSETLL